MGNHPNRSRRKAVLPPSKEALKALRASAGWTQQQCADAIYVTLNGYQKWESGERPLHLAFYELLLVKIQDWHR
jgi:putative transcriptional regulator